MQCATTSSDLATSCVSATASQPCSSRSLRGCPPRTDETGAVETPNEASADKSDGVTTAQGYSAKIAKWLGEEKTKLFGGLGCID